MPLMDEIVARSMAKWPDVPDVYGWLSLDRRGNWRIKEEKIGNAALRDFISRNYQPDARGCWYFQNGPQRVFVSLAYTPLVLQFEGEALLSVVEHEPLGADAITDLLMVNMKGPDYNAHAYGPDSPELKETLAELDRQITRVLDAWPSRGGHRFQLTRVRSLPATKS